MSFVKKGLKKAWNFVKDNWKTIVLVAAIAFTAGVATIGFSAFAGVSGGGFFSAVGSTMWAGVAGTAGSLGIGSGAVVPAGGMTTLGGTVVAGGTHVGFGAAAGLGGGAGLGAGAGSNIAAANTKVALEAGAKVAFDAAVATGATAEEAMLAQQAYVNSSLGTASTSTAQGTQLVNAGSLGGGGGAGMSDAAWKTLGVAAPVAGAALMAAGEEQEWEQVDYMAVNEKTGAGMPSKSVVGGPAAGKKAGPRKAPTAAEAADALMQERLNASRASIARPLMRNYGLGDDYAGVGV